MSHILLLYTDRLEGGAVTERPLSGANRAIYVAEGMATISADGAAATLSANSAWFNTGPVSLKAAPEGAVVLRYELHRLSNGGDEFATGAGIESGLSRKAELTLDDPDGYLMRCDRVDLPPGGIAYTHVHQGGGIRCLVEGGFNVKVMGDTHTIGRYESWFEAGPDPVYAWASDDLPGCFSRVMILPRRLKGQSSLRYVNPEDHDKPKRQKYTVFLDEFIEI